MIGWKVCEMFLPDGGLDVPYSAYRVGLTRYKVEYTGGLASVRARLRNSSIGWICQSAIYALYIYVYIDWRGF